MKMKKLVAPSLTDLFVDEMKRMILTGELKAGTKLAPERQLADESGVSLAVVNAAITRLTSLGLLKVKPRKGVFVADYVREGNLDTLKEVVEFSGGKLGPEIIIPVAACRRGIETGAAREACRNISDEDLEVLSGLLDKAADPENIDDMPQMAFDFYHNIAIAGKNPYYPMIIRSFESMYLLFYREFTNYETLPKEIESLKKLLDAIKARDELQVTNAINEAIDEWLENVGITEEVGRR